MMEELNRIIDGSGLKLGFIAKELGMTYQSLHNKLTGKRKFTLKEAIGLRELLNIPDDRWIEIFGDVEVK